MKRVISLFLSLVMLVSITAGLNITANAEEELFIYYDILDDGTAEVVGLGGTKVAEVEYLNIPEFVEDEGRDVKVTRIGQDLKNGFDRAKKLKGIYIPEGVKTIGEWAFYRCYKLNTVILPDSVETIEQSAFSDCTRLANITWPASLKTIGDYAFYNCQSIVAVNLGDNVQSIGKGAFGCNSLFSITIPKSLKNVSEYAFDYCKNLTGVFYKGSEAEWNRIAIGLHNKPLTNAEIMYDSTECAAGEHYGFWHTVNDNTFLLCFDCGLLGTVLQFKDLKGFEIYGDYVAYTSVYNNFIAGTNPTDYTLFSPKTAITRAMFVAILYRMAGNPYADSNPHTTNPFTDIMPGVYYYDAACWALDNGITNQTTFRPNDNVTREQTARFLYAYAEKENMLGDDEYKLVDLSGYPDLNRVHDWAVEPLKWANYNDMITGTQQGFINPQGNTQRIHATRILYGFGTLCGIGEF